MTSLLETGIVNVRTHALLNSVPDLRKIQERFGKGEAEGGELIATNGHRLGWGRTSVEEISQYHVEHGCFCWTLAQFPMLSILTGVFFSAGGREREEGSWWTYH